MVFELGQHGPEGLDGDGPQGAVFVGDLGLGIEEDLEVRQRPAIPEGPQGFDRPAPLVVGTGLEHQQQGLEDNFVEAVAVSRSCSRA